MVVKRLVVVVVAIALIAVAVGVGYLLLAQGPETIPPVTPPAGAAPTVTLTVPIKGATGTPINVKVLATFSTAMNPSTITTATFTLKHGTIAVPGAVTYTATTATFSPTSNLGALTVHTATITTGAKDSSGRALAANFVWNFTTSSAVDNTAPQVSFTSPTAGATGTATNAKILATFSKAMDPSSISASTFTLKRGTTAVAGTVSLAGTTATFAPSSNLGAGTAYTATITTGAKDSLGHALAATFVWSFTTGQVVDTFAPRVSFVSPAAASTGAAVNAQILATFSEAMDPSTLTTATFSLKQGATSVSGIHTYSGTTATFVPSNNLAQQTVYTATITTGAKDLASNALAANFVWSFTTAAGQVGDTRAPTVTSVAPGIGATNVPLNSGVSAAFSEALDPSTISVSSFYLMEGTTPVSGLVSYAGWTAAFDPSSDFTPDTSYTATVTTGVKDPAGNSLAANYVWTFRTGATQDIIRPTVSSTNPGAGATDVPRASDVRATFSEAMDPSTITVSTFSVMQGTTPVSGLVSYTGLTATFDPSSDFGSGATYTATVTTSALDLAGNALQSEFVWSFSTGSSPCGQSTVALGLAASFAVLAGSTVTNTGPTIVTGDLGASPGTEITGFPPGTVVGATHAGDSVAVGGLADLTTAYNDAAGRTLCAQTVDGNLGGQTLAPGLYKSESSLEISSGDLTLDAQGDSNAVFIFQMGSTLTTTIGRQIILAGGAQAKNIFWVVGSSATIGVNSTFIGTILADQSITLTTGAVLDGRALARIGAVTLDSNTATKPGA